MLLSRDCSENLKGYFATNWSHLWLPYNGRLNYIKIIREPFMKQTVTYLNDPSELVVFFTSSIEHYTFDSFFGSLSVDSSPTEDVDKLSEINNCTIVSFMGEIVDLIVDSSIQVHKILGEVMKPTLQAGHPRMQAHALRFILKLPST